MMYPFITFDDETELTHSEYLPSGQVRVHVETPDAEDGFHYLECRLPDFNITELFGYSDDEVKMYMEIIRSKADLIMYYSKNGGK